MPIITAGAGIVVAKPKPTTSFRLSDEARRILEQYADDRGLSQASILELAIREYRDNHPITKKREIRPKGR